MERDEAIKALKEMTMLFAAMAVTEHENEKSRKMFKRYTFALEEILDDLKQGLNEAPEREARLEYIKANITEAAMLAQIAEEAAELSAAAAKMLRILDGTNPTPVTSKDAVLAMREEFADVLNTCAVYGITPYSAQDDAAQKLERWAWRIAKGVQGGEE